MTASLKGKGIPCEHRFLSCMAFGTYEVIRVVCLSRSKLFFYRILCGIGQFQSHLWFCRSR